ncbi:hypothetical protein CFC21_084166 [Triticum aestivum]|uniref:Uncharacterized protein n=3 Tax=Triticum TaxID=4564 RepID=A0A9R0Y4F0_TRITD|nr:uncharacterized protein LOC119317621 isoform X1 [Triticum dicoccoides]XP_044404031.1 uncharacterized protein LOC123128160 [Triticum aestivum]KAF7080015.1 hypothetical protein CFC21_084166 [Triticum aestivum]VAI48616.1 unnamed protein product [Triticum turgidum subsp. durum]
MERFDEYDCASAHSHQHPDRVSDSLEDPISDEDVQPTRLSLACATTKKREDDNRMAGHNESAIWDEVQEEADELAHVHKDPHAHSVSLLSAGTSKRSKCENKLKFSIRGFNSILSGVKSENSYAGEQEVLSGMRPAKAIETMMAEQFENIDEETETEELPPDFAHPTKNANISVAELLEDLQDRSASSVRTPFSIHQQTEAKEGKPKVSTSGKKILALLGQRDLDSEEHSEHAIGETSSEDEAEDTVRNNLTMVNKDVKGNRKTMSDLFQEAFTATDMEGTALPMRSTGAGYYGRMQQIMQMEKDRHAEFSRQYNRARDYLGDSKGVTVQILSRSLEGKLTVCLCLLKEKSNLPLTDCDMDDSSSKRTIIFSPKICDNVDLVEGNIIHIHPPWKEVKVKEEEVMLCTYFSHHLA